MASLGERVGLDAIKKGYDLYANCPYFALFELTNKKPTRIMFSYRDEDRDGEGWRKLEENLQALEQSLPEAPCLIQFYDTLNKHGAIDTATPCVGSFPMRMRPFSGPQAIAGVGVVSPNADFLTYLQNELRFEKEKNLILTEEVEDLKAELEELERAPKGAAIEGVIGQIGEAGNAFPWLADIIKDWSTIFKHKVMNTGQPASNRQRDGAIAGVATDAPPDVRINGAIRKLVAWYMKEYGGSGTDQDKQMRGMEQFASDMQLLAGLTADDDIIHLALKKLRQMA